MREDAAETTRLRSIATVGKGRLGGALSLALKRAGYDVVGPVGRGEVPVADAILLCVPDADIEAAAATVAGAAPLVGHTSGATPLTALGAPDAFGLHPLQTVTGRDADFEGCGCAIGGSTPRALDAARELATRLHMRSFEIDDGDRPAYHAAASIASNFLVTLLASAEAVAETMGLPRELLAPLVETTVRNWAALGPERALTGPVVRGDEATVASQRSAIADRSPEALALFDALVERTRVLAGVPA